MVPNKLYSVIESSNMKFLVLVFVQLLVVHIVWSAISQGGNFSHPDYPGKCYYNHSDSPIILIPFEEVTIKGQCTSVTCGSDFSMLFVLCGSYSGPYEDVPVNHSLPYPDCCPGNNRPPNEDYVEPL